MKDLSEMKTKENEKLFYIVNHIMIEECKEITATVKDPKLKIYINHNHSSIPLKETLIKYIMGKADLQYNDDFPIEKIETWINEFFDEFKI